MKLRIEATFALCFFFISRAFLVVGISLYIHNLSHCLSYSMMTYTIYGIYFSFLFRTRIFNRHDAAVAVLREI